MAWSKDYGKSAKLAAAEALAQAQRAELVADYIDEKQPLIDEFIGEQTNLQTQLNDLVLQSGTDIAEVVQARGGEATLNARLDKTAAQMAEMENKDNSSLVNVKYPPKPLVSAKGDGITDDTDAINAIIQYVKNNSLGGLYFPDEGNNEYMIRATGESNIFPAGTLDGGLIVDHPMTITLHPNATLKAITGNKVGYAILTIRNTDNVVLEGGKILGERSTHIGTTGEFGFGIQIFNSENIILRNIEVNDCWGDGIIIDASVQSPFYGYDSRASKNISIENVTCDNNRRQGISLLACEKVKIINSTFSNTNGTAPQFGIDLEADHDHKTKDVTIQNCKFIGNVGGGILTGDGLGCENVNILGNTFIVTANSYGILNVETSDLKKTENVKMANNEFLLNDASVAIAGLGIKKSLISGNTVTSINKNGLFLSSASNIPVDCIVSNNIINNLSVAINVTNNNKTIKFIGNTFENVGTRLAISLNVGDSTKITFEGNSLKNSGGVSISGKNAFINGNVFDSLVELALDNTNLRNSIISNNLFVNVGTANSLNTPHVIQDITCKANTFIGNTFDWEGDATWVRAVRVDATEGKHVVKNNVFRNYNEAIAPSEFDFIEGNLSILP